jgi:Flp pilus assembly protein TadD
MVGDLIGKVVLLLIVLPLLYAPAFGQTTAVDWINKGNELVADAKYDEAIQAYNKAIDINPEDADAWWGKDNALRQSGRYTEAMEAEAAYEKIVDAPGYTRPLTAIDWVNKGEELAADAKYDEALQAFNKAIEINPQEKIAWAEKGDTLKAIGRTKEANEAYAKANELEAANTITILDHSMASSVNESTKSAIGRTYKFSSNDSKAYSWLRLGNVGADAVWWEWWSPAGHLLYNDRVDIPSPTSGDHWSAYNLWDHIDIAGHDAANLSGDWHVDVLLKGQKLLTEDFSISGNTTISSNATSSIAILDHSIASNIDKYTGVPTRTDTFSRNDSKVYSWLSLGNVGAGTVWWWWYDQEGNLYDDGRGQFLHMVAIPPPAYGDYWPSYNVSNFMDVNIPAYRNMSGNWGVDIGFTENGQVKKMQHLLTEQFTMVAPRNSSLPPVTIIDHCMASRVDESTNSVITRTNTFSSNDSNAYSWLSLGNVGAGAVGWVWRDPEGNAYYGTTLDIPPYSNGDYWPSFNAWSDIDIQGMVDNWKNPHYNPILETIENPDNPFGNWSVTVTVDCVNDHVSLTEPFTLEGNAIQNNARSYGRAEAEEAEWMISQREQKEADIYYHYLKGEEAPLYDYY